MIRSIIFVVVFTHLVGCSTVAGWFGKKKPQGPPAPTYNAEAAAQFSKGVAQLDAGKYREAKAIFKSILVDRPTSKFEMVISFNLAAAYEGLGQCKRAASKFRQVARYSVGKFPKIEALSLLRLSYAYECLGKSTSAAATLVDVLQRRSQLPAQVGLAEVPARLAGVYAQLGNQKEALVYFKMAEKGLVSLNKKKIDSRAKQELMAKTLYLMGKLKMSSLNRVGAEKFLESVKYLQKYLLKSVEMDSKKWSPKAADQLKVAYRQIWSHLNSLPSGGKTVDEQRQNIKSRVRIAEKAYLGLQLLKSSRFPGDISQPLVVSLFEQLDKEESRFQVFMAENIVGNSLTPESQKLQGLRREGRGVGRTTKLERRVKRKKGIPKPSKNNSNNSKDPNL